MAGGEDAGPRPALLAQVRGRLEAALVDDVVRHSRLGLSQQQSSLRVYAW